MHKVLPGDAPVNLPAIHRRRSNCQEGTGADSLRRLVDGEASECLGTKKEALGAPFTNGIDPQLGMWYRQKIFSELFSLTPKR